MALKLFEGECGQKLKEFISSCESSRSRKAFISTTVSKEGFQSGWLIFSQDSEIDDDSDTKFLLNDKGQIRTFKTVDSAVNVLRNLEVVTILTAI